MAARETGKHRAARIPYDYLAGRDGFIARRIALSVLALCAVAGWAAWGLVDRDGGRSRLSHGPLSVAHAAWQTKCDACHVGPGLGGLASGRMVSIISDDGDHQCRSCHMGNDSQVHHAVARADRVPHCAACHREHEGRDASMVRLADGDCTSCHRDLATAASTGQTKFGRAISRFDDHPAFRSTASDPGRLKFNHALHMTEGLTYAGDSVRPTTFGSHPAARLERYGWKEGVDLGRPIKLDCTSCHRLDDATAGGSGAYYRPIAYDTDCAACHSLTVPGREGGGNSARLAARGIGNDTVDRAALGRAIVIPHRLQPAELVDNLRATYLGLLLEDNPGLADDATPLALPGRRPVEESARRQVAQRAESAAGLLLGPGKATCTECHYYRDPSGREHAGPDGIVVPRDWRIQPTAVPSRWLRHGRFDHTAHRAIDCRSCHARAYADAPDKSAAGNPGWASHSDVLVPSIENCRSCHAPRGKKGDEPSGGARFDCTECHTYHDGDHPPQGRGARARGATEGNLKDIRRFLLGTSAGGR